MRHRILMSVGLMLAVAAAAAPSALAGPTATRSAAVVKKPVIVNVKAFEYGFTFSRKTAPVGPVWFVIKNIGKTAHDLDVIPFPKSPYIAPGHSYTLKIVFKKKGKYQYYCTLPRHADYGMKGIFTVK